MTKIGIGRSRAEGGGPLGSALVEKERFRQSARERLGVAAAHLLIASMKRGSYKLAQHHFKPHENVGLVEVYESLEKQDTAYARVYVKPTADQVPAVCFGGVEDVGKIAYRDNLSMLPYKGNRGIETPSGHIDAADFQALPGIEPILEATRRPFYAVRPSSFALSAVWNNVSEDSLSKTKVYTNALEPASVDPQLLAHVTYPDEAFDLHPDLGLYGWALTNSETYANTHGELDWM